jgi:hypothetical protein
MNGNFTKINYTHPHFTMNGLFFAIPFSTTFVENASENTHFIHFDTSLSSNRSIIDSIVKLEHEILQNYAVLMIPNTKIMSRYMNKQLSKGKLKINGDTKNNKIVLKISGVWENESEYGITFRWVYAQSIL